MHDVARVNKDYDQDEYKNAFYVALMLRNMGDERFQGEEISEDGLKMIMDLATKESKKADKSLMSKLIQSSDSLAILRVEKFRNNILKYDYNKNDFYNDLCQILFCEETRDLMELVYYLVEQNKKIFKNPNHLLNINLEFQSNPKQFFMELDIAKEFDLFFVKANNRLRKPIKSDDFAIEKVDAEHFFIMVLTRQKDPLSKSNPTKFSPVTAILNSAKILSYADRGWQNNPFIIFRDVIAIASFKTDIGSNYLNETLKNNLPIFNENAFQSNVERAVYLSMRDRSVTHYMGKAYFIWENFQEKLKESFAKRIGAIEDISSGDYELIDKMGNILHDKVGFNRFQSAYSAPHYELKTPVGALRHNEVHAYTPLHLMDYVAVNKNVFEKGVYFTGHIPSSSFDAILSAHQNCQKINKKKLELLDSKNPMKDDLFAGCVEAELNRVTTVFEKIYELKKQEQEILQNPDNKYWKKASLRKSKKLTKFPDYVFHEKSEKNKQNWNAKAISKIHDDLKKLYEDLDKFEDPQNFGFSGLKDFIDNINDWEQGLSFGEKMAKWKEKILKGGEHNKQLEYAISRVKAGLSHETKFVLYDLFNPNDLRLVNQDDIDLKLKEFNPQGFFNFLVKNHDFKTIFSIFKKGEREGHFGEFCLKEFRDVEFQMTGFDSYVCKRIGNKYLQGSRIKKDQNLDEIFDLIDLGLSVCDEERILTSSQNLLMPLLLHLTICAQEPNKFMGFINRSKIPEQKKQQIKKLHSHLICSGALISTKSDESFAHKDEFLESQFFGSSEIFRMRRFNKKFENLDEEFQEELKEKLKQYNSKEDLKKIVTINFIDKKICSSSKYSVELNGYGLLRIFEQRILKENLKLEDEIITLFKRLRAIKNNEIIESFLPSALIMSKAEGSKLISDDKVISRV